MSDLYDTDIIIWSERQAELLRRLAAGEGVNDRVDWENVIEEIEAVGRSERRACESHLMLALLHDLKAEGWPLSLDLPHWRAEARLHRLEARRASTPGMRQRLDLAKLYAEALSALPEAVGGQPPQPVPETCPVTLDELLGEQS